MRNDSEMSTLVHTLHWSTSRVSLPLSTPLLQRPVIPPGSSPLPVPLRFDKGALDWDCQKAERSPSKGKQKQ